MHNIMLIAKREYLERVRTKAFIIATILIPVLLGGIGFGSGYLSQRTQTAAQLILLSDGTATGNTFTHDLQAELQSPDEDGKASQINATAEVNSAPVRAALDSRLKDKKDPLSGYLQVLPPATAGARPGFSYTPRSSSDISTLGTLRQAIKVTLNREHLAHEGLSKADIDGLLKPVEIDTSKTGNTIAAFFAAYALFFMMYFVIMQFGMNTARSIIEEKTSRVFEVLLATITPDEMLAGKILGVGAVGLTQVGIWMLAAGGIGAYVVATSSTGAHAYVTAGQIAFFIAYFLFGFLIYSSIAAALGAMTNSEQELQQLNMFLVIPLALCMLMLPTMIKAPDSTLARVVSQIPFCAPLLMNFRISIGNPQTWEIVLSFVTMAAFIALVLWLASRIYRVGILMYGKKPNLPEILRWLKYS